MSIILVVTSFVGDNTGGVVGATRVAVFFFFSSEAALAADQSTIIETIAARQAAGFIAESGCLLKGSGRQPMHSNGRASGEDGLELLPGQFYEVQYLCQELLAFFNNGLR